MSSLAWGECISNSYHNNRTGITVSAGELEEGNAKALAEACQERDQALSALQEAREEIRALRSRTTWTEIDEDAITD